MMGSSKIIYCKKKSRKSCEPVVFHILRVYNLVAKSLVAQGFSDLSPTMYTSKTGDHGA